MRLANHGHWARAGLLATTLCSTAGLAATAAQAPLPAPQSLAGDTIVATVNGDVITQDDVDNRARLFAVSTGLPATPDVLLRLRPQITRQLIDERLRMQEIQRRRIVVPDDEIARAIDEIEHRNNMGKGGLQARLRGEGVAPRTLFDQLRVQLGWTRVLRQTLAGRARVDETEVANQQREYKEQTGQTQYRLGEIFVAIEDPAHAADAKRFADTIIQQLHSGAPFAVVAAQFSQSQTALEGGDLGWLAADHLDPEVASLVAQMPQGAISNPVRVAGGFDIVQMRGKRQVGLEKQTMLSVRAAFLPFTVKLNPQAPTDQQKQTLVHAQALSKSAHDCSAIEAANAQAGSKRPADPGVLPLANINPQMRAILEPLKIGQPSRPLVSPDGIAVLMVCSRDDKPTPIATHDEISEQLLQDRVELASRQLQRDLRRRALIDDRTSS